MSSERVIVIPDIWKTEASIDIVRLNRIQPGYSFLYMPVLNVKSKKPLSLLYHLLLRPSKVGSALFILPKNFALGTKIQYWPELFYQFDSRVVVTSVHFADSWNECLRFINAVTTSDNNIEKYNATCQYQHPYTDSLMQWVDAGARNFHPGDFTRDEFFSALKHMHGHWMYWGHADGRKLRGYHHLTSDDLLDHSPSSPLRSTLWFSCSTLDIRLKRNIALDWYLSGSTHCLFASTQPVITEANQMLSAEWLNALQQSKKISIDGIIRQLVMRNPGTFIPVLQHYRLLGWG